MGYIYEYIAHSQSQFLTPVFIISVFRFWNYYAKQKVLTESHMEHILLFWSHTITGSAIPEELRINSSTVRRRSFSSLTHYVLPNLAILTNGFIIQKSFVISE